jgi:hypothetical protein
MIFCDLFLQLSGIFVVKMNNNKEFFREEEKENEENFTITSSHLIVNTFVSNSKSKSKHKKRDF